MSMFYDERIRAVVNQEWAERDFSAINYRGSDIPEDQVDPEDSALLKDTKIPLVFKVAVAQKLYENEDEEVKERVRSKRNADLFSINIHDASDEDRAELVRAYQK